MGNRLCIDGISSPSTNDSAVAMSQYAAGAAKGKRWRPRSVPMRTTTAGIANQRVVLSELRPRTSSTTAATPRAAIRSSNQYSRARNLTRLEFMC
jgi:hypothetical protein